LGSGEDDFWQDPRKAMAFTGCRNSDALFVPKCQSFLDNVVAHLRAGRSWNDLADRCSRLFWRSRGAKRAQFPDCIKQLLPAGKQY
jgi:hypothetical protein